MPLQYHVSFPHRKRQHTHSHRNKPGGKHIAKCQLTSLNRCRIKTGKPSSGLILHHSPQHRQGNGHRIDYQNPRKRPHLDQIFRILLILQGIPVSTHTFQHLYHIFTVQAPQKDYHQPQHDHHGQY